MYASVDDARSAYAGEDADDVQLRVVMSSAAGIVDGAAVPPLMREEAPDWPVFTEKAANAELFIGGYLWTTGGYVKRESVLDATVEYGTFVDVMSAVRQTLSPYVRDLEAEAEERRTKSRTFDVASTFPAVPAEDDLLWRW